MFLYRMLLRLYSAEYQYDFGSEMLAVFRQAADEHRTLGILTYLQFLTAECAGLIKGALSEHHFRSSLAPFCGGIIFAAVVNYLFYSGILRLLATVDRALHNASLLGADPLAMPITIAMFGLAALLALLPLFIFLGSRINPRPS